MRGRTVFMDSLRLHGVRAIFGNPGTTESPLLDSLVDYPDIRYVTVLHESIAVSAAVLYAQASGESVVANVHVAPGLGNALGSLYGALKSSAPLVLTAGAQDTRLRLRDPVLGHDLVAMAAPLVKWATQVNNADEMAAVMQRAFTIANEAPKGPVFVALPINVMEQETTNAAWAGGRVHADPRPDDATIAAAAAILANAQKPVIVASDDVARAGAAPRSSRSPNGSARRCIKTRCASTSCSRTNMSRTAARCRSTRRRCVRCSAAPTSLLMLGGPFFEEVWYDAVRAVPENEKIVQLAHAPGVIARNFGVAAGDRVRAEARESKRYCTRSNPRCRPRRARRGSPTSLRAQSNVAKPRRRASRSSDDARPMPPVRALTEIAAAMPPNGVVVDESITATGEVARDLRLQGDRRLLRTTRRRHRPRHRRRARRRGRAARAAGRRDLGRRLGDVHDPVAVDCGAARSLDRVRDPRESRVPRAEAQHRHVSRALRRERRTVRIRTWTSRRRSTSPRWRVAWVSPRSASKTRRRCSAR